LFDPTIIVIWLISVAVTLIVFYAIIRAAVRAALIDRYKVIRWYEKTGEWLPNVGSWKEPPRAEK
jgi:hypothetical protein